MKRCFTFSNYRDCQRVVKYLKETLSTLVHTQLGNSISVYDNMYKEAITIGKKYIIENGIECYWVDNFGNEMPIVLVPFCYITLYQSETIAPYCLSADAISSISVFSELCQYYLERKVFTQIVNNEIVVFLIEDTMSTEDHLKVVEHLQNHSQHLCCNAGSKICFTDCFGYNI